MSSDGGAPPNTPTLGRCLEHLDVFVIAGGLGTRIEPVLGKGPEAFGADFLGGLIWRTC